MFCTLEGAGKFMRFAFPGAAAGAVEDAEVLFPGADGIAVLVGEDSGDLVEVGHVVDGPGGKEFGERYCAEGSMTATEGDLLGLEVEGAQGGEVLSTEAGEVVEELGQGFAGAQAELGVAVKWIKGAGFAVLEDEARAGKPVGLLAVDEVADDVKG